MDIVIIDGLSFALPLFIMAIGGIYCEKSGVTMLAVEGLQGFGAFIGAFGGGCHCGKLCRRLSGAFLHCHGYGGCGRKSVCTDSCHVMSEVQGQSGYQWCGSQYSGHGADRIFTKLFNRVVFGATSDKFVLTVSSRITIPGISKIPVLGAVFTNLYPFELVIVVVAFVAWFVMYKTRFGMHLRACGDNPHAVDAAGRQVGQIRLAAIMICGALSGLGGICFAYSISANFSSSIYVGYGYLAIAALIFGNWRILPTLGACLLFGFARSGGYRLVQVLQMPSSYQDLVMILPYVLTLLLLVFFSKQNGAPRALGVIYDKGAR